MNTVPILCYHEVEESSAPGPYTISPTTFSDHLHHLSQNKYQTLSLDEYVQTCSKPKKEPESKKVIITFDDGHRSQFEHAYPMIHEKNFKATFFITTDYINHDPYVSQDNLMEMQKNGMEIGGHAQSHAFLDELDNRLLTGELLNSKNKLVDTLGKRIDFFSCPGGRYNRRVIECASNLGYRGMGTSYPGSHTIRDGLYIFSRILIRKSTSLQEFINIVNMKSSLLLKLRYADTIKTITKKALGNRLYYQLWSQYAKK